jgi:hypothetical protein
MTPKSEPTLDSAPGLANVRSMKRPSSLAAAVGLLLFLTGAPLQAELQWASRVVSHEAQLGEDSVSLTFAFSNPTTKPITITAIETSCGCTAASLEKKTYAPGEKGKLDVTFDAKGASGLQQKTLYVTTDASPDSTTLTLRVTIPMWLEIAPRLLWWKNGDKTDAKEAVITVNEKAKIQLTSVTSDNAAVQATLQPDAGNASRYRLVLKPASTKETMTATITVVAEAPGAAPRKYAVFAQVR